MNWLMFTLAAPLASFGSPGSVETRGSSPLPTRSALLGLLGAALGLRRDDAAGLGQLAALARFACRVENPGRVLSDYHTVQTPPQPLLRKAPHYTRRDELAFPRDELRTVLSTREYHQDFRATIGVQSDDVQALQRFDTALRQPRFTLYVGRKSCAPAWPLAPHLIKGQPWESALQSFDVLRSEEAERWKQAVARTYLWWPLRAAQLSQHAAERELAGMLRDPRQWRETLRRDDPRDRQRWLFASHAWLERSDNSEMGGTA